MMKKINGVETISTQQQREILLWYTISKRLLLLCIMLLVAATVTQWYLHRYYAPSCTPCISKAYADEINKKHTATKNGAQNKKVIETERARGTALIAHYATALALHHDQVQNTQLTDLKLTPQGFTARYMITNRNAVQPLLDHLTASSEIQKASLESIEQKNNVITCTIQAVWKK
jgi:hypothetical protein